VLVVVKKKKRIKPGRGRGASAESGAPLFCDVAKRGAVGARKRTKRCPSPATDVLESGSNRRDRAMSR